MSIANDTGKAAIARTRNQNAAVQANLDARMDALKDRTDANARAYKKAVTQKNK